MRVTTIDTFPDELDDIARCSPRGTYYHTGAWIGSLVATYPGLSFRCLIAEDGGEVRGYLPFFYTRRGPFRTAWSMPFGTYGGPVSVSGDADRALLEAYERVLSGLDVVKVGWVDFSGTDAESTGAWEAGGCSTHLVDISVGFENVWADKIERQRKKRSRRAERLGVAIRRKQSDDDVRRYYSIYSDRIEGWGGGDKYPRQLFFELLARSGDSARLYVAFRGDDFLGGHLNFYFKDMVTSWNGVTSIESNHLQPATALYIHCMKEACEEGYSRYNLGGSLNKQSLIDYKESLGGEPFQYFQYQRSSIVGRVLSGVKRIGGLR
jgi:CelD/BcsL family acetyltransferase involved in cellulose biosynthesis